MGTLQRILTEATIRGTSRLTRGPIPVVSFTERLPQDLGAIRKWRSGLLRWSFEPYGLGVPKRILLELGARPVVYCDEHELLSATSEELPFMQIRKTARTEWSGEQEWRLRGDLDLNLVALDQLLIIVRSQQESGIIEERFGCNVVIVEPEG